MNVDRESKSLSINPIITAIPHTEPWGSNTALVMIICNLLAVAISLGIGRLRPVDAQTGSNLTAAIDVFKNFNLAELLAALSFGHILGVGMVLGLTNVGII
jgi:photosystem I subunit X